MQPSQADVQSDKLPSVVIFIDVRTTFDVEQDEYLHSTMVFLEAFRIEARLCHVWAKTSRSATVSCS